MSKAINAIIMILLLGGILYCDSYIQVIAEPGIRVFLDSAFKGETNSAEEGLIIDSVSAGSHKIKFVRTGFIEQEEEISIKSGEVFSYTVKPFIPKLKITQSGEGQGNNIVQKSGTLKIQSIPVAINIEIIRLGIDDAKEKDEWLAESVPIGKYKAIFTRNNDNLDFQVEISENKTTHLMVNMFSKKVEILKEKTRHPSSAILDRISKGMVFVKGGSFQMGSNDGYSNQKPVHSVTLSDFYIGKYEVTQGEYEALMEKNPSKFKESGKDAPVEKINWFNAVEFCNKLSDKEGLERCYTVSGWSVTYDFNVNGYRLPTEAEWEYARRGGNKSNGYIYAGSNDIDRVAWYSDNSGGKTHRVGDKLANELGIYDMSGNVREWCNDRYGDYNSNSQANPHGPNSGEDTVCRGGSFSEDAKGCLASHRHKDGRGFNRTDLGFRLARSSK